MSKKAKGKAQTWPIVTAVDLGFPEGQDRSASCVGPAAQSLFKAAAEYACEAERAKQKP